MDADTSKQRLSTVRQMIEHASRALQQNDAASALRRLEEATASLQPLGDDESPERLTLAASIAEGKGQIAMTQGQAEEAFLQLTQAVALRRREGRASGQPRLLQIAIGHLNLSAACSQLGRHPEALDESRRALEALDALGPDKTARFMKLAGLQSQALLIHRLEPPDHARAAWDRALAFGAELLGDGLPEVPELLVQIRIHASLQRHEQGHAAEARALGLDAAALAWERVEKSGSPRAGQQYLTAQMNLVTFCERAGDFGGAEDALFRVLRLVGPDPQVLARGRALYNHLLTLDDATLAAGNLPREEVVDSLAELESLARPVAQA